MSGDIPVGRVEFAPWVPTYECGPVFSFSPISPPLLSAEEEVWLRAWVVVTQQQPLLRQDAHRVADECLRDFRERFRK